MTNKDKSYVEGQIKSKKVFVISKTYCPFATKAKDVLKKYDISPENIEILEIDGSEFCEEIQDYMKSLTGARTVPRVFIGGECIGGGSETESLHKSKKLEPMLKNVGAI
ncbi:glutaredoxin-1 [Lepeophtheirus salmonis]|uniref:Glutaredoxin-1 n=1 Tax=Lepeophtheirus salmonis TaxID=72036 RepID=C1BSP4_LEPSM|nr:glutaredoxin-1-like isoform X2 [Lepeophtheirus salmonis]XP_040572959.1 glutaredoxin-1-like isoform X2 [Lepeophtheirus salmonis]XP_040572960.1 glutaredoxin-1-like isoform X2 [Lepeophtheirus salmonis]ACO12047.1 Glutaredoxin-1 [Lepeophtheirus salmonis]ADD38648.1 Glutaredoxin-1 [Lepeophtheirus salmonis]